MNEKEDLILSHKKNGYLEDAFETFLVNSLKAAYEKELVEDGLIKMEMKNKDIVVMCGDPSPNLSYEYAVELSNKIQTEEELAELFAATDNKARWICDDIYDFEEETEEYVAARENIDRWFAIADALKDRIFKILKEEGIEIPERGQIFVLEPFMLRNGFVDGCGWWIEESQY